MGHASCSGSWASLVDRRVSAACGATLRQRCCFLFFGVLDSGESIKFKARHGLSGPFPGKQLVKHLPSKHLLLRRSSSEPRSSAASFLQSIVLSVAQKILEESGVK